MQNSALNVAKSFNGGVDDEKTFRYYSIVWGILLALFNVIAFVSVGWVGQEKYTASFWIGYVFIMLTFVGHIICTYFALKESDIKKTFYNISLISKSYTGLILSFIFGGLCMLISPLPYWVGVILCAIFLVRNVIAVVKASAAIDLVSGVDEKNRTKTFFIKFLTVDAENLIARAKSEPVKAECKKVYEAVRYSDPMSRDALASIESEITATFSKLKEVVAADDSASASEIASELIVLLGDRDKKCKLLK